MLFCITYFREDKNIKKTINIAFVIVSLVVLTLATIYGISQTSFVQKIIINKITSNISKSINADVTIGRVKFSLFSKVVLNDFYLSDQNKDTLLYTHKLIASVDSFSFINKSIHFRSISLVEPKVHAAKYDSSTFNFNFLFSNNDQHSKNTWRANSAMIEIKEGEFFYSAPLLINDIQKLMHLRKINLKLQRFKFNAQNNFSFYLNNLRFICDNGLEINNLTSSFAYSDSIISLENFAITSTNSNVKIDSIALDIKKYLISKNVLDLKFDVLINQVYLNFDDFSFLYPDFKSEGLNAQLSGRLYGKPGEIKGKNFKASLGDLTRINGDFYINGLPELENTYLFINLLESYADLNQLRNIKLPQEIVPFKLELPAFLNNVGVFSYSGNFTGFLNDFVAYGSVYSNLGSIDGDVSFQPDNNNLLKVKGHISTQNLRIGSIFNTEYLGRLTLNGNIDGSIKDTIYNLNFNGIIDSIDIKNYKYRNIGIKGNLKNKLFNGSLSIDDPNLKMSYLGNLDLLPALPVFKFSANISYADLHALNLVQDSVSKISGNINANFIGNNIDNMLGELEINQLRYKNSTDILFLDNAKINNNFLGNENLLTINSDWFDAEIKGHYSFINFSKTLSGFYKHYLPSAFLEPFENNESDNHFSYSVNFKNVNQITKTFLPDLFVKTPFSISGYLFEKENDAKLETIIPLIIFKGREASNLSVQVKASPENISCIVNSNQLKVSDNIYIQNVLVNSVGNNDNLSIDLSWKNNGSKKSFGNISSNTSFEKTNSRFPHLEINIDPASFYIADSLWNLNATNIGIDSTEVFFKGLSLNNNNQKLAINGKLSENDNAMAFIKIDNLDFSLFDLIFGKTGVDGILNGTIDIADIYNKQKINIDLILKQLSYDNAIFGDVVLKSNWNSDIDKLVSSISLKENDKLLINGNGFIDPINNLVNLNLDLNKTPAKLLEILVPFLFYDMKGNVNGNVLVSGKTNHLLFNGKLTPETRLGVGISFLKTHYYISHPVYFKGDSILFPEIRFEDELGNKGILNGNIAHLNFGNLTYDLKINTDKIMVMNTSLSDNEYFYGTAFASGNLNIIGHDSEVTLNGDFTTEKGTNLNIPLERKNKIEKYDFIQFVNTNSKAEQQPEYNLVTNGLNMNFDINVTPDAKVQLIFNSQIGDIIKGEGNGSLQVKVDKDFKINLYGDYIIEKGDYLFTLENIINKRFTINRGGTIKWSGDPYNAQLDITAVYRVKTSLYDLFPGSNNQMDLVRRLPVDCIIKLNESLLQPNIDFKIELPTAEESIKDEINRIIVTKEDVNKQMVSLLIMGRFYTPEFFAGKAPTETGTELVGSTASELFSNQLSNMLSRISDEVDIGINYRPGNDISNDQVELALSTQILNDRVTIDGNIANNSNTSSKNSGELVGDFDIKVKITNDGRLQFKVFNHSNDNIIYETAPYTQGIGISYREEFNTLSELLKQYKDALLRKKTKLPKPKEE